MRVSDAADITYKSASGATAVGSLMIASGVLLLLSTLVLVAGALKEEATLLIPWMAYMLSFIVTNSFLHIIASAQDIEMRYHSSGDANAVISVIVFLLQLYFLYVVSCLYTQLKGTATPNHTTTQTASRPWTTTA